MVKSANWVGDAVMTIPALRELRRVLPHAHITLATRPSIEALFDEANYIDDILVSDSARGGLGPIIRQTKQWRAGRFDLAVLFQNAFGAALIGFAAGVPRRLGYATDGRSLLLSTPIQVPSWRGDRHEIFYYLNLIAELDERLHGKSSVMQHEPEYGLTVSPERQQEARELLRSAGARENRPLVVLCPGSTNSRAKRWPAERYAAISDRVTRDLNAVVVLIGSQDEVDVSETVSGFSSSKPIMLTGRTELAQAVAVLSLADVVVTNDTGPAHISAALDRPTLVIFGPTNPVTTRPFSSSSEVIRRPPDCAPCMLRDCPIDHRCMTAIDPDEVFSRVSALLKLQSAGVNT